jgi:hypothetical protein
MRLLSSIVVISSLLALAYCLDLQPVNAPTPKAQPNGANKQLAPSCPTCPTAPTACPATGDDGSATGVHYWDNLQYQEMDDVDLSALGDIAQNNVFGRLCRICPLFLLRCPCPPFFRCVFVPRTCTRCAYYRCVPRIPIPLPTLPIPIPIPTIPFPDPWEIYN